MYLEIFLADFAVFHFFWEFRGISRKYLNFAGPQPREIPETLTRVILVFIPGDKELNIILLLCVFT